MSSWGLASGDELASGRRVVGTLGGGPRYETYLAWDERLRWPGVAKLVRPDQVSDGLAGAALDREARLLRRLAHPLLVRSYGTEPHAPHPHLALEWVDGRRLSALTSRPGLGVERVLELALELSSLLHYLADEGVVHLALAPRTMIAAPTPRVIDLTDAYQLGEPSLWEPPAAGGAYLAPEQCDPDLLDELGPAADVWAFGATIIEALTGGLPYPRPHERNAHPQLVHVARAPDGLPHEIEDLLMACVERRPSDRPAAGELGDALAPLVERRTAPSAGRFARRAGG
jgi:eukaryotic-like serine/threonine-protein kinase